MNDSQESSSLPFIVVDKISKSRSINYSQLQPNPILLDIYTKLSSDVSKHAPALTCTYTFNLNGLSPVHTRSRDVFGLI
jgi:hypothetical protein